jgi:hypothetical protein
MKGSILIAEDELFPKRASSQWLGLGWFGPIHEAQDGRTAIAVKRSVYTAES